MPFLAYVAFAIIALAVLLYVLMDGWDLGVGILFLLAARERDRDEMMESIAPFWDGNETWLVFGGVTLFAAFPAVYASTLQTLYLPVMVMLFALVFRGISFEFRAQCKRLQNALELGLCVGFCHSGIRARNDAWEAGPGCSASTRTVWANIHYQPVSTSWRNGDGVWLRSIGFCVAGL